ncbi:DUF192 domain-containing protein [bacterium]|nr:DUF192 domain-containing protein [bacterium]
MKYLKRGVLILVVSFLFLSSSSKQYVQVLLPDGEEITAELAVTERQRVRGLMFREGIKENQGMLFVMEEEGPHGFWMKNMKFSIDILWLNEHKRIVHLESQVPPCKSPPCPTYQSEIPAKYVLELKAGSVEKYNLEVYEKVDFILPEIIHKKRSVELTHPQP